MCINIRKFLRTVLNLRGTVHEHCNIKSPFGGVSFPNTKWSIRVEFLSYLNLSLGDMKTSKKFFKFSSNDVILLSNASM